MQLAQHDANEWFALSIIDQVHNLQPKFMGYETYLLLVSKFFWEKLLLCWKGIICVSMIPWKSIKVSNILSAHAKPCAWLFKTPGLGPAHWSKDQGSFCEGLIPEVAKPSKALPKWAPFCPMILSKWWDQSTKFLTPRLSTTEGLHSNHKNIKVLVEAFESALYSPQSIFDTRSSQYCQLFMLCGYF